MRTKEQLEAYFAKRRKAEEYKRWVEERKRINAREAVKKALEKKKKQQLQQQKTIIVEKTITVSTTTIGDFYEENLYQTRDQLKEWEQQHHPCINWSNWDRIVEQTKQTLQLLL